MSQFEFLSVALSFVLGLAVTLLLTSFLVAFRARHKTRLGWLPLTWALYVLVMQFDLWWEVYGLSSMKRWTAGSFVLLLVLALSLFAAGGPSGWSPHFWSLAVSPTWCCLASTPWAA